MAAEQRLMTGEETLNAIREKAKEGDEFRVKVFRRMNMGVPPELKASFAGAQLEHLASPELWLPQLCGGGKYTLQAYHSSDNSKPVGGMLSHAIGGEPSEVDMDAPTRANWRGPSQLDFPPRAAPAPARDTMGYDIKPPPAPGSGDNATRTPAWPRQAGGGVFAPNYGGGESAYDLDQRRHATLEAERRRFEAEKLEAKDREYRQEMERQKKEHENEMRTLRAEIRSELAAKPQGPDSTVLILQKMLETQAEDRRATALTAAEDRRAAEARQAANDERFNRLLEKMADRPKEDPLAMVEKVAKLVGSNNSNEAQTKMMHSMSEMMQSQVGVAMDFVQAAADLQLGAQGEKESPIVKGIEAAVKGLGAMARGGQRRPPQQFAQPPLPAGQTYEQQARQPAPPPPPPPNQQPAPQAPPPPGPPSILQQIEFGIYGNAPPNLVAKALVDNFQDPSVQAALAEAGLDIEVVIQNRLGAWIAQSAANAAYVELLKKEIEKQFAEAGFFGEDDGGDGGDAPDGGPADDE